MRRRRLRRHISKIFKLFYTVSIVFELIAAMLIICNIPSITVQYSSIRIIDDDDQTH